MIEWFWDTMVSMTLLMVLVLMIRKPVAHYFGANVSYLLWALPLARMFMPVLTLAAPAPAVISEPIALSSVTADLLVVETAQIAATSAFSSIDWLTVMLIIWAGGAAMLFISKLAAYIQFREDIVSDGQLVGRHDNIKILETAAVTGPLAFGLIRKYIAVPTDFFRNYAPRERELALEHEITHHESGDLAANFIGLFILSLHWFNPVAWFSWMAFRQDQETACDARILQKSGRDIRAVYGRTIAKSASGHQLGLASPLGQKDKIKGRLKMLGQTEKSSLRKRLGALMVGVTTVVALPLTATVTYAEAIEPVDLSVPAIPMPPVAPLAPEAPVPPKAPKLAKNTQRVAIDKSGDTINITMLNGSKDFKNDKQYVRRIKHDGRTIILRTNRKLTDVQAIEMVEEAEESRHEADRELKEFERERKEMDRELRVEMREAEREAREDRREWQQEMRETQREVERSVREAEREARQAQREAVREARRHVEHSARRASEEAREATNRAAHLSQISYKPKHKSDCSTMGKAIAFGGQPGAQQDRAWAAVVGCNSFEIKIAQKALMKITLRALKEQRKAAAKSCDNPDAKLRHDLRNYDRKIDHLQKKLQTI
ncbi:hypothetical protein MNBD_ALPHA04-202 [hydrothermal vent metagenome]|uniref:Peptidase M56 domain-containing protein n=1 Tax=hydrothermal vent metagenome TaxID=652676 RepID=A0A3B0T3M8_9ZZZZ